MKGRKFRTKRILYRSIRIRLRKSGVIKLKEEKAEVKQKNKEQTKTKYKEMKAAEKVRMLQEKEEQAPGVVEVVLY